MIATSKPAGSLLGARAARRSARNFLAAALLGCTGVLLLEPAVAPQPAVAQFGIGNFRIIIPNPGGYRQKGKRPKKSKPSKANPSNEDASTPSREPSPTLPGSTGSAGSPPSSAGSSSPTSPPPQGSGSGRRRRGLDDTPAE